ncbi:unnamed protein product, partial [Phaeothamnion confervicola]
MNKVFPIMARAVNYLARVDRLTTSYPVWVPLAAWDDTVAKMTAPPGGGSLGSTAATAALVKVPAGFRAAKVACSAALTAVLAESGALYTFGFNRWGQCGLGHDNLHVYGPHRVGPPVEHGGVWLDVALGLQHAVALAAGGTVWAWGKGERGQLGNGFLENHFLPERVHIGEPVTAVAAGFSHGAALAASGRVYLWGKMLSPEVKEHRRLVTIHHDQVRFRFTDI